MNIIFLKEQESSPEKNKNVSNQNGFFDDQKINKDVQSNILQINLAQNIFDKFQSRQQGQLELENSQEINNDNECENSKSININPNQNQNYIQVDVNQREQILQQENFQQQVIHNKICEIGKGKFGNVIQIIDFQDKNFPFYARKTFYKFEDYMQEKQNYIEIDYSTTEQVQNFLMKMTQFNDEEKYFHQKLGYCSLIEFAKMRRQHNIIWRKNEIYYLFYRLADFVLKFSSLQIAQLDFKFDQSSCNKNIKISQDQKCAISYGDFPNQLALMKYEKLFQNEFNKNFVINHGFRKNLDYEFTFYIKNFTTEVAIGIYNDCQELESFQLGQSVLKKQIYQLQKISLYSVNSITKKMEKKDKYLNCYLISSNGKVFKHKSDVIQENFSFKIGDTIKCILNQQEKTLEFYKNENEFLYNIENIEPVPLNENYYPACLLQKEKDQVSVVKPIISKAKYYHGDLKPQNVIITDKYLIQQPLMHSHQSMQQELQGNIQDRILQLKIIDFGGASSELSNKMLTPIYFNSFKRKVLANQEVVFKDEEERFKGEIYSILRTFLKVCISSSYQKYVDVQFIFKTSTEIIQKMQIVANDDTQQELYDSNDLQNILKNEKNVNIVDEKQNIKFQDKQHFAETYKDIDIKDKQQIQGQKTFIATLNTIQNFQTNRFQQRYLTFSFQFLTPLGIKSNLKVGICQTMQQVQEEIKYYLVQKNGDVIYGENNSGYSNHILSSKILFEQYDIIVFEIDIMDLSFQFYNIINPNYKSPVVKLFQSESQSNQQNNKSLNFNIYPCCILEPNESVGFENGPVLGKYFQGILSQIQNQKLQQTQFDKKESVYQNQVDQTIQYTEEENIYIIEGLKNQVFNEYCLHDQQFSAFLDFLKEDILQENYTRQYLQNYIEQNIAFSQNENYNGIIDPVQESVIQKIIQQKIQINNPLELVFQLKSYIPGTKCTRNEKDNEKLDLMTEVDRFLTDFRTKSQQQNQKQIFILVGDSGTGKTSFINQIQHHYEFLTNNQHNMIQVHKLRFGQYHSQKQLEQDVEQIYINFQKKINNQVHINQYQGSSLGQQNQQPTIRYDSQSNFPQQNYLNMQKLYTPSYQLQNINQTKYENLQLNQRQGQVDIKIQKEMANSQQQFNYKYINETINQSDNSLKIENKLQNSFEYNQSHNFKQGQNNQNFQNNLGYQSFQMSQNNYISQINQQNNSNSQYIQKTSQIKIIFLLDGYDEISFKQESNANSQNTNIGDEKAHSTTSSSSYKLNLVEIFKLDQFINVKLIITSRKETIPENSLSQIFTFDSQDPKENQMLVRKKCTFYYISLFQPSQIVQFIDKYIESVNDSALNLYTNKVSFSKEQYLQYFKKNKELEQMASNPLMLRIILEVLPKIQQVLNYQFQLNKSQDWLYINKKAFSRYNLYKEFIKNWISVKVQVKLDHQQIQKIAQQQQSQAFLDQELQFIKKNSQIQRFEDKKEPINIQKAKFRIFVFNRILAMGLFVQTTQTFTKQNVLQIFKNQKNQKCGFINIGGDIESYLQCSPVKKNGENYEYIHKSVFEYYVADNILTEIQLITKEIIKPEIPQIKIQVEKMGGKQYLKRNNVSQLKNWFSNQSYMNNDNEQKLTQLNNLDVINMKLNQVRLNRSHLTIIRFIQNYYFQYDNYENLKQLQKVLQKLIQYSRPKENKKKNLYLSSNAATIYNALNFSFSGLDLSNTELEGAILQSAIMHKTNMQNANLKHAQLSASILQESNIIGANIQNADFGKMPDLKKQEKPIQCVIYSPNGKYIASGDDDSNVTLYLLNNPDQFYRREKVHQKGVNSISFSPNSKYLVSGSSDKSIVVWDTSLQVLVQKNNAHKDSITCVKFSQNKFNKSLIIATASEDSYIIIWKFIQYKQDYAFSNQESFNYDLVPEHYLKEHQSCVTSIAFFDDGKKLISGSEDEQGIILIWEETKVAWVVRQKLKTGLSLVDQIAISPDNNFIIASSSEEIQIWKQISYFQMNHMKDWIKYQSLDSGATCVAFSNDGKYVATGNRVIKLWNVESGELLQIMEGNSVVKDLIFSPFSSQLENNYIIAGHYDNTIKIYNISITQQLQLRDGHREEVVSLVISQDEKLIASGGVGGHIKIWNLESGELVTQMNGFHTMGVNQMEFCEDIYGNTILISVGGKVIYIWETQTGRKVATYFGHEEDIICVSYNSIYRQIATGSLDKTIKVWPIPDYFNNVSPQSLNIEKYGTSQIYDNLNLPNYEPDPLITYQVPNCVNAVKYSQTCQFLAAGLDNIVSVYLVHKNYQNSAQKQIYEPIMVFNQNTINPTDLHVGTILSVAFLPDERIVSAGQDKKINVWCLDNQGYIDCQIDANMGDINKISYLPVYQPFSYAQSQKKKEKPIYIVAGGTNQLIKIWDINQKRIGGNISKFMISVPALIIRGHQGPIYCMSVSPSGKYIASGSKSLKIWKRKYKYVQVNNNFNQQQKSVLQNNIKNSDQASNLQKINEQSDNSGQQENKQLLQEQLQINQQRHNLAQQSQQQQQQQQFQIIEYLLQRNISKSQAFQCYGLKYSNCEIKGSGPNGELTKNELNILLLRQYSYEDDYF